MHADADLIICSKRALYRACDSPNSIQHSAMIGHVFVTVLHLAWSVPVLQRRQEVL